MEQQTNVPAIEQDDEMNFFGDEGDSTESDELDFNEGADEEPSKDEPAQDAKPAGEKVKIKFMGKEEEIDLSDRETLVTLLQKGKNYDNVHADLESLKNSEDLNFLKQMAKEAGLPDTKSFIDKVKTDLENQRIQGRAQELMDEGMSEEHAIHTAKLEMQVKAGTPQPTKTAEQEAPDSKGFLELLEEYPEVAQFKTLDDYPEPVKEAILAGKPPIVAYQKHLLAEAKKANEIEKINQSAKQRDLGSMKNAKNAEPDDPFLTGLNS